MHSRQDRHINQFYAWELRGRGMLLADEPIDLEAPFHPFFMHRTPQPYTDDGVRHTLTSRVAEWLRGTRHVDTIPAPEIPPIEPFAHDTGGSLGILRLSIPKGANIRQEKLEHLVAALAIERGRYSFELIARRDAIIIQLVCDSSRIHTVRTLTRSFVPEAIITETDDHLTMFDSPGVVADYGLAEEFMRPLASGGGEHDPYLPLFASFEQVREGEQAILQVLFEGAVNDWSGSIRRSVTINGKDSFFVDAPEMPALAAEKTSRPLVAATVRLLVQAPEPARADILFDTLSRSLITLSASAYNSLRALGGDGYDFETRIYDILDRESRRLGMLLNVRELATLAHFPNASVRTPTLFYAARATKAAPHTSGTYCIGCNTHDGITVSAHIPQADRLQHVHLIGATGTGKSTLLHSLICQDIAQGRGVAVLDPHGDLIEQILPHIPEERIADVVLIDPSDAEHPVSFNILHAHTDTEKELLASDLVVLFRRFSSSWGDQMNSVFANAILAILESSEGGTLIDLRRFLIEKPFRERFLATVQDEAIRYYWLHEYPLLKTSSIGSILTRLDAFLRPKLIRNMVSQKRSLDMASLMDKRAIILVKLSHGLMGEENSYLLGASIVAKIQQAAMARQAKAQDARTPFFLYIDEFHHFATPSLSHILTGTRKYGLGLIVSHQDMQQVSRHDPELAATLLANAGTRICFRCGEADAKKLAEGFSSFTASDIQQLRRGEAIVRIGAADRDCSVTVSPYAAPAHNHTDRIIAASRAAYAGMPVPLPPATPHAPPVSPQPPPSHIPQVLQHDTEVVIARQEEKHHRYLQQQVKKLAEECGYAAHIEYPVDGGKVDVSLERDGTKIAVEISVSTKPDWELHNIRKCLAAGYDTVIACSEQPQTLRAIREKVREQCTPQEQERIIVCTPRELAAHIRPIREQEEPGEKRIKGYRVSVSYSSLSEAERVQKEAAVGRIVREGMQ
jgi:hypothetical protein